VLRLCQESGLLKVGRLALDGTKIKAFSEIASRHGLVSNRAMSYDRMTTDELRLPAEIAELLKQAQATDAAEDREHGRDQRGDELPAELARRENRLEKIREALCSLHASGVTARSNSRLARRRRRTRGSRLRRSTRQTPCPSRRLNGTSPIPSRRS